MNEELRELVRTLEQDHRHLLSEIRFLEQSVAGEKGAPDAKFWRRIVETFNRIHDKLKIHGELEEAKLFPALRQATGEESNWQLGMTEMQDGLILKEIERLHDLAGRKPTGISLPELKESTSHLTRWLHEHIEIEEKFLFTKILNFSKPPEE